MNRCQCSDPAIVAVPTRAIEVLLQVKGKFGLRNRAVQVHEASFIAEAETELLGGALAQWTATAEGAVAAAALEVRIAERRLQYGAARYALP